jgi:hypothetical protein
MMAPNQYLARSRYHQVWSAKYAATSVGCFAGAMWALPARGAFVLMGLGYVLLYLSRREQRRARMVLP